MGNDPVEKAKASLGEAWKAARSAAEGVKKEIERAGIARSLEDVGREIARATTNVAGHLGTELEELGREIRLKAEGTAASGANEPAPPGTSPGATQAGGAPPGPTTPSSGATQAGPRPSTDDDRAGRGEPPTSGPGAAPGGGGVRIATD